MAITALQLAAVSEYVSDLDPSKTEDPENATYFELGTLDSRISAHISDKTTKFSVDTTGRETDSAETSVAINAVAFERVQFGLRGWRNFRDGQGNDISFKTMKRNVGGKSYTIVDPTLMELIPPAVIKELSDKIDEQNSGKGRLGNA